MQIISLLVGGQTPSTERCGWRRKTPDYIDVSEIKPNPIVKWFKDKWKRTVAIVIIRFARCWNRTDPGGSMLITAAIVLGITFSTFPLMTNDYTFNHIIWGAMCLSVKFVILFITLMYGMWELFQLGKWLHKWAGKHYQARYDDE